MNGKRHYTSLGPGYAVTLTKFDTPQSQVLEFAAAGALERTEVSALRQALDAWLVTVQPPAISTPGRRRTVISAQGEVNVADRLLVELIALGPRHDRQYSEPTEDDQRRWDAWDTAYAAIVERADAIGLSPAKPHTKVDKVVFAVLKALDLPEAWERARQWPRLVRESVEMAVGEYVAKE